MRSKSMFRGLAALITLLVAALAAAGASALRASPAPADPNDAPLATRRSTPHPATAETGRDAAPDSGSRVLPDAPAPAVQDPTPPSRADTALRVYLLTMGPGDAVWERFGHNAIRIVDPVRGEDVTYNYGMFDFAAEDFFPRFLRGDMLYWMAGFPSRAVVDAYARSNRAVYAQELNLTAEQKRRLREFLEWNARPENRYYAYDYYRDNCATRVRDAIDRALGGQLEAVLGDVATATTYRSHTRRLTANDLPIYTGLNLAMGAAIDRPLTAWEESFLPMRLREHLRTVRVRGPDGMPVPLVRSETVLVAADRAAVPEQAPDRRTGYLLAGAVLGAIFLGLGRLTARGRRIGRLGLVAAGGAWAVGTGVLGTVIALLWAMTNHTVTYGNENLLQINPLPLALVVLLPLAVLRGRAVRAARWLAWAAATASAAGLLLQALPGFDQVNGEIIALALPAHFGLAGGLWVASRRHPVDRGARVSERVRGTPLSPSAPRA